MKNDQQSYDEQHNKSNSFTGIGCQHTNVHNVFTLNNCHSDGAYFFGLRN